MEIIFETCRKINFRIPEKKEWQLKTIARTNGTQNAHPYAGGIDQLLTFSCLIKMKLKLVFYFVEYKKFDKLNPAAKELSEAFLAVCINPI